MTGSILNQQPHEEVTWLVGNEHKTNINFSIHFLPFFFKEKNCGFQVSGGRHFPGSASEWINWGPAGKNWAQRTDSTGSCKETSRPRAASQFVKSLNSRLQLGQHIVSVDSSRSQVKLSRLKTLSSQSTHTVWLFRSISASTLKDQWLLNEWLSQQLVVAGNCIPVEIREVIALESEAVEKGKD